MTLLVQILIITIFWVPNSDPQIQIKHLNSNNKTYHVLPIAIDELMFENGFDYRNKDFGQKEVTDVGSSTSKIIKRKTVCNDNFSIIFHLLPFLIDQPPPGFHTI